MKTLPCLWNRSFVALALAVVCCAKPLLAAEDFVVEPSNQDLFGKANQEYKIRVRVNGQGAGVTDVLKIKVWKITSAPPDATQPTGTLALADAGGEVVVTDKGGNIITELPVRNGQEDFRIKPLTTASQNLVIQLYTTDPSKPVGYMVLAINPTAGKAEKDIKTVSTPIGVGRH